EIGAEARSMHKCQGMGQLLALPGSGGGAATYQLVESTVAPQGEEQSLFDGIDTTIAGLAKFAGPTPSRDLIDGLASIASAAQTAQKAFDTQSDGATLQPIVAGLEAVRALRSRLRGLRLDEAAMFEIDFRLQQKEKEFEQAALLANAVRLEVLADAGIVVPGQSVRVNTIVANRGAADVTVKQVTFDGFQRGGSCTMTAYSGAGFGGPGGGGRG